MAELGFAIEPLPQPRSFRITGALDVPSAGHFTELLDELVRENGDVLLDLSGVTFMDSSGLRSVIQAGMDLGDRGRIRLRHPNAQVRRLLEVSGAGGSLANIVVEEESPEG
jgi:anti-sigma B factor antagonist